MSSGVRLFLFRQFGLSRRSKHFPRPFFQAGKSKFCMGNQDVYKNSTENFDAQANSAVISYSRGAEITNQIEGQCYDLTELEDFTTLVVHIRVLYALKRKLINCFHVLSKEPELW